MYMNASGRELTLSAAISNWTITGAAGGKRTGTAKNDMFYSIWNDTLAGGAGDDTYELWDAGSKVVENPGEGIDTINVKYWGGITLSDGVENVFLMSKGATWAKGNALDNLIVAGVTGATLNGGAGNDVLVGGAGDDVFYVKAGNGSDVVMNFRPGWDVVRLDGYGIATYDQLKGMAKQSGSDVTIKLSSTENLIIRDMQLSSLGAADFNLSVDAQSPFLTDKTLATANQAWSANGWTVFNNAWGAGDMKPGVDFTMKSTLNTGDMTRGTTFNWTFPAVTTDLRVLAYPEVIFGMSPYNLTGTNTDKAHVFPVKVSDLVGLTATYDVTFGGNVGGFNVAYDIWLSDSATGTGKAAVTNEVMIWVHQGSFSFDSLGEPVGIYSKDGFTAKIYHNGTYTALVADKDVPKGTIDIADVLAMLQKLGIVSPTEYVRSVELGSEVLSGTGYLTINDLDLRVETKTATGGTTVMEVGGSGTTVTTVEPTMAKFMEIYKAGTEKIVDQYGNVIGSKTTVIPVKEKAVTTIHDAYGKVIGTDIFVIDNGGIVAQHRNAGNVLVGAEKTVYNADGSTQIIHYDANWTVIGSEKIHTDAQGRLVTQHYDAAWNPNGMDMVTVEASGAKLTNHYDASWKLVGADRVTVSGTTTTIQHFDSKWALTGAEMVTTKADGSTVVRHLDNGMKIVSIDQFKMTAEGLRTYHYDGNGGLLGSEAVMTKPNGVGRTAVYDGKDKLASVVWNGTDNGDTIAGFGSGNGNSFHGGKGSDALYGAAGVDKFYFDTAIGQGDVDLIYGFQVSQDRVMLDHNIFTKLGIGNLDPSQFVPGTVARDANDHLLFDSAQGNLYYDSDGNGALAPILLAQVKVDGALTAGNFMVV